MKKQNLIAFAIALIVMFSIAVISTAIAPTAKVSQPNVSESVTNNSTGADFSFSSEAENPATVNILKAGFQRSDFIAKDVGRIQINYPKIAENPKYNENRYYELVQINGYKFEITPNWRSCKTDTYQFMSDFRPELVWRE